ncbi:MAG: ACP S-malonyltransferase [Gammaproteobacteria bacterium]|nr:ACP S-malonyltransferase [Gammaproteobacteria bacterium]
MALAFVFPGQGSQSLGMLNDLAESFPVVRQTFTEASDAFGRDLWDLVTQGPVEDMNQTQNTQPLMLTTGVAVWRVWQEKSGAQPVVMAGHSLGEYSALVCAQALDFIDAVKLVADRGKFMQDAVPEGKGAMAAIIGMDDYLVEKICELEANGEVLSAVNFNCPGQVVIAGTSAAVRRAVAQASAAGARRAVVLPVSVPSHCALMHEAAEKMAERLKSVEIRSPSIPVIHNASVNTESDPEKIRELLVRQVESPVKWSETINKMVEANDVDKIVECGPGNVLTGLGKRINRAATSFSVSDPENLQKALAACAG